MTLRCCIREQCDDSPSESTCHMIGLAIATCCHHLCQWKHYISNLPSAGSRLMIFSVAHISFDSVLVSPRKCSFISITLWLTEIHEWYLPQISNICWIRESARMISMPWHGLPAGPSMQIMVQTLVALIGLLIYRSGMVFLLFRPQRFLYLPHFLFSCS